MKKIAYFVLFIFVLIIIIPTVMIKGYELFYGRSKEQKLSPGEIPVKVYLHNKDEIVTMALEDYVEGVVAGEMPALFHIEALKAQAVAARTFAVRRMKIYGGRGCGLHPQADVCTDSTHCQAWLSDDELKQKWGVLGYYKYKPKISKSVKSTKGLIITYRGKPIDPVFHSTSGGKTENSEDVWGNVVPYLRSVVSPYEEDSPKLVGEFSFDLNYFVSKLNEAYPDLNLKLEHLKTMEVVEEGEGGRIVKLRIKNKIVRGMDIRKIFKLNSSNFNWEIQGSRIVFTTIGYGHGVGMSQYGANGMAKAGKTYEQILKHYYTGVEIEKIK